MPLPEIWNTTGANGDLLLNGIRLSSTLLEAAMWSIDILGVLNNTYTTQVSPIFASIHR